MPLPEWLRYAAGLMRPRRAELAAAVALGALSLGSALALTAVSAWLITRAWQMPPILDLTIAVVAVRALGISRAVFGYLERLVSHDTALRAAGTARQGIYRRLACGPADVATRLRSGDLLGRVGGDVDTLADAVARALVPLGVAAVLGVAATALIAVISVPAAAVLAGCLLAAGGLGPWLAARAARAQEALARVDRADRDAAALLALEHAAELRVAGRLPGIIAESERRNARWAAGLDRAAAPAAAAPAVLTLVQGVSVIGILVVGITIAPLTAPTTVAVLMLVPLAAFEAAAALPAAAVALIRARIAADHLAELAPAAELHPGVVITPPDHTPHLQAFDVRAGFPGSPCGPAISIDLPPGARLAITGRSGAGKTALLMTLAALLPPRGGTVTLDGVDCRRLTESELRSMDCFFAEDAHIFATTVRDNLLVARGDCPDAMLQESLSKVGLGTWLDTLPQGLDTVLRGGAAAVSAGQRRRLLLARALLSPAPVVLLDEPTEHLDPADAQHLLRGLLDAHGGLIHPGRTVVVATHHLGSDIDCPRLSVGG